MNKQTEEALAEAALNQMQKNAEELGLTYCKHGSDSACKECYMEQAEKQEPVAVITPDNYGEPRLDFIGTFKYKATTAVNPDILLYTHPATWQSLSDDEIAELNLDGYADESELDFARAIEQALKEKNYGN